MWRKTLLFFLFLFIPFVGLHALSTGSSDPRPLQPLIVIDAGHGGTDEGAKVQTVMEKRMTLTTALLTKKHLEALGYRVILTRSRDIFVSLQRRVAIANKSRAALFVSVHFNSSPNRTAKGIEIFYYDSKDQQRVRDSKKLGNTILQYLVDQTEATSRGVRRGNFYVVRETAMPAVLVEGGFMTNYEERFLLKDRKYLDKIAKGISQGVQKFLEN